MKIIDITKKRKPKTIVFQRKDEFISFYEVWIYPYAKMPTGARVHFFRANKEEKVVCCIYLEKDFEPSPDKKLLGDEQYRNFIDGLCAIAQKALADKDIQIEEDYDVHISEGILTYDHFT